MLCMNITRMISFKGRWSDLCAKKHDNDTLLETLE